MRISRLFIAMICLSFLHEACVDLAAERSSRDDPKLRQRNDAVMRYHSDSAGENATLTDSDRNQSVIRDVMIVTGDQPEEAVTLAANDLGKYLKLACPQVRVAIKKAAAVSPQELRENSLILLGNDKVNELIDRTKQAAHLTYRISYRERYQEITGVPLKDPGAGFWSSPLPLRMRRTRW